MADTNTPNLGLAVVEPTRRNWATAMNRNMIVLDAAVGAYFTLQNLQGVWQNSTAYTVGQSVIDEDTSAVYVCDVAHTSASIPTTFLEDRTANSTYWSVYSTPARYRGAWATATSYAINDFVLNNGTQYAIAVASHVSGATFAADLAAGKWSVLVDMQVAVDAATAAAASQVAAAASAAAALVSENNAETAETNAETAETNAAASAVAAAASASAASTSATTASTAATTATTQATTATTQATNAAASASSASTSATNAAASAALAATLAAGVLATSTSSVAIGTGAKSFTTQAGKQFQAGQFIKVVDSAVTTNYMWGTVTSYSGTSLVIDVTVTGGSGTIASWNISISGSRGVAGAVSSVSGRLSLVTAQPVMASDQTAKTVVYWTPYNGSDVPVYNGSEFVSTSMIEANNDITSAAANVGPVAAQPYSIYDFFLMAGNYLVRGPRWTVSATATMTIATPCVVTWTGHGLWTGATVRFTTTGALPTGVTAATDYFITKIDANTFYLSTTLANNITSTYVATSGTQSGVHTAFNFTSVRGTGAGTTELEMVNGIWVNKNAITNGPAARYGTYVGSAYTNGSSQIDFKFGSNAANFGEAFIGIWNAYNRVKISGAVTTTVASWSTVGGGVQRVFQQSATARVSAISGLAEDSLSGTAQCKLSCDGATSGYMSLLFRALQWTGNLFSSTYINAGSSQDPYPQTYSIAPSPFLGLGYMVPIDTCINYTSSYVNTAGQAAFLVYDWRY